MSSKNIFYDLLRDIVGDRALSESLRVDVRRVGDLGRVFDVSVDGVGVGCFTATEVEAQSQLADVLANVRDGYGGAA
jgi:hypothetical protein